MTDFTLVAGRSPSNPRHYGRAKFTGSASVTYVTDADLAAPDANAVATGNVRVITSSPITVGPEFFGQHIYYRANDGVTDSTIPFKTVRSHDIENGKGRWSFTETSDNVWNFTDLDKWVNSHYAAGRDLVFTLFGTPSWAAGDKSGEIGVYGGANPGLSAPPADMTKWTRYCSTVATRYAGKIKYYEVWNEPNMNNNGTTTTHASNFFFSGTWVQLSEMTRRANQAIKAADPTAKIISPPVQGWASTGTDTSGEYCAGMFEASDGATGKLKDWVDIFGVHLYTSNSTDTLAVSTDRAIAARLAAGLTALEIWDTESAPISVKCPSLSDLQIRRYMTRFLVTLAAKGIKRTIFYLYDSSTFGFNGRTDVETHWKQLRTLLMSGGILKVSQLFDGRIVCTTTEGQKVY